MKIRLLRKLLSNTELDISSITDIFNRNSIITIGRVNVSGVIVLDIHNLNVCYSFPNRTEGREYIESVSDKELLYIWDRLHELIESGEIQDIIQGRDEIENPLPVFTIHNGELIRSVTDAYGYPNIDDNGVCMYNNTHYSTIKDAIEWATKEYSDCIVNDLSEIKELEKDLLRRSTRMKAYEKYLIALNTIKY